MKIALQMPRLRRADSAENRRVERDLEVSVQGRKRVAKVALPDPSRYPVPRGVILSFHGFTDFGWRHDSSTKMSKLATERGFAVITPTGKGGLLNELPDILEPFHSWDGFDMSDFKVVSAQDHGDRPYVRALLQGIEALWNEEVSKEAGEFNVQDAPVLVTGFSNGGFFSHQLAEDLGQDYDVVLAPVDGLAAPGLELSKENGPVPAILFQGRQDRIVSGDGKWLGLFGHMGEGVMKTARALAEHNGFKGKPKTYRFRELKGDLDQAIAKADPRCKGPVEVTVFGDDPRRRVVVVQGDYGHAWPGANFPGQQLPPLNKVYSAIGLKGTDTIDATKVILDFYEKAGAADAVSKAG